MTLRFVLAVGGCLLACNGSPGGPDGGPSDGQASDVVPSDGSSNDGSVDGGSEAAPPCTLTSPPSNTTCASCEQSNCCSAENNCAASSACMGFVACERACVATDGGTMNDNPDAGPADGGGFPCNIACQMQYHAGANAGILVIDCEDNTCAGMGCP